MLHRSLVLLVMLLMAPAGAWAQLTTGTITGVVKDSSGGFVPGVTVVVQNVETGAARTIVTGVDGRYEAPNLPVGNYAVKAELTGFQTTNRSGINLTVGRTAVVDLELKVGNMTEAVEVKGEAALLETTSATVSNLVDAKRVVELPLINRDLTQLTFLQPGVLKMPTPGAGNSGSFSGMGDKLSVAGARGNQNIFMLDGVSNSDLSGNPQGATGGYAGAETIQEFQIITNNYSAEYRSQAGAIISAVTKSGTNRFRGSMFEFHRNDALDAANFFDKKFGVEKPQFDRNQFGGSVGGPIARNRTFFFTAYEGLRQDQGQTSTINVPTMAARQGILPTGIVAVNPIVVPYLNLYPVPGDGNTVVRDLGNGTVQLAYEANEKIDGDLFTLKIDHRLSDGKRGMLSGTYNYDDSSRQNFGILRSDALLNNKHALAIKHTSVLAATTLLDSSFNFSDTQPEGDVPLMPPDDPSLVFTPGKPRIGELIISSPSISMLGTSRDRDAYFQRSYSLGQNLTFQRGRHSMRVGYDASFYRYIQDTCSNGCFGSYTFRTLTTFLQNVPRRFDARLPDAVNVKTLDQAMIGTYIQDNFRIAPSFTLNMGLRYEYLERPGRAERRDIPRDGSDARDPAGATQRAWRSLQESDGEGVQSAGRVRVGAGRREDLHSGRLRHVLRAPRVLPHPYRPAGTTAVQSVGTHRRRRREPAGASAPLPGCVHHAGRHARRPSEHARVPVRPRHLVRLPLESDRPAPVRSELGRDRGLHGIAVHESLVAGSSQYQTVGGVPRAAVRSEVLPGRRAADQPGTGRRANSGTRTLMPTITADRSVCRSGSAPACISRPRTHFEDG